MADKPAFNPSGDYKKPKFDPSAPIGAAQLSPEQATIASLPNAAQQAKASQPQLGDPNANLSQSQLGESATDIPTAANVLEHSVGPAGFAAKHPVQAAAAIPGALLGAAVAPATIAGAAGVGAAGAGMGSQVTQVLSGKNPLSSDSLTETGKNTAIGGAVGATLGTVSPVAQWISASKASGAKFLQAAADKAATQAVTLSPETNKLVDEIMQQDASGNPAPGVIKKLLERLGPNPNSLAGAEPGPLTYPEARNFQSNASRLSAAEKLDDKGSMKALMAKFSKSFGQDVSSAADDAGVGTLHRAGMQQYATASSRDKILSTVGKAALASTGIGGSAIAGYELLKKFGVTK